MSALDQLNVKWDAASDRFNLLTDVAPGPEREINGNIADWQDFYWGEARSPGDLLAWEGKYMRTAALLDRASRATTVAKSVEQTSYYKPPVKSVRLPPLLITAAPPRPPAYLLPPPRPSPPLPPEYIRPKPYAGYVSAPTSLGSTKLMF